MNYAPNIVIAGEGVREIPDGMGTLIDISQLQIPSLYCILSIYSVNPFVLSPFELEILPKGRDV